MVITNVETSVAPGSLDKQICQRPSARSVIGLPRALEYHRSHRIWKVFFDELGYETVSSPETDAGILRRGAALSVDESCLAAKIFLGHIDYLKDKCDYILTPRLCNLGAGEDSCVKFNALPDTARLLADNILAYNIDYAAGYSMQRAYGDVGRKLGLSRRRTLDALKAALYEHELDCRQAASETRKSLAKDNLKILAVGYAYNIYDKLIGAPVLDYFRKAGAEVIIAGECNCLPELSKNLARTIYWTHSKQLLAAISEHSGNVDGIVLITAFPCGPDSLTNELIMRKVKKPILNIVADEHSSPTGLETRLESFVDVLQNISYKI